MEFSFAKSGQPKSGVLVVTAFDGGKLSATAEAIDVASDGALGKAIKAAKFKGAKESGLSLYSPANTGLDRVFVLGLGKPAEFDDQAAQNAGGYLAGALEKVAGTPVVALELAPKSKLSDGEAAANFAFGARLGSYRFDKYFTKKDKDEKPQLKGFKILSSDAAGAKTLFDTLDKVADGVFLTRDLVSEPANVLSPEELAKRAKKALEPLGVKITTLGEKEMAKLGMNALLGVGQGSERESQMVIMEWNGAKGKKAKKGKADAPIAFVGKGVCFDSGGISIKPSASMEDMKWDMGGAGVVVGLMAALAGRKAKVDAVGVIGLVENMPSGTAQRPGDVVKSANGQTIEVINTDAEGRLVLADALWYCQKEFKPHTMIDLATLTGAIIICLGDQKAGLFSDDDKLAKQLYATGEAVGESLWRMPLGPEYDKMINSDIADMKNVGARGAGSTTAAQFLKRFVDGPKWAHLDIAGVTWATKGKPVVPKGGSGFGVRLLDRLVADHYEDK